MKLSYESFALPDGSFCGVESILSEPCDINYWVKPAAKGVSPWRVLERRVATGFNKIDIVNASGTKWVAEVKGIQSGNIEKAWLRLYCGDSDKLSEYRPGQFIEQLGVPADYFIAYGLLGAMELEGFNRPMAAIESAASRHAEEIRQLKADCRQVEEEHSRKVARLESLAAEYRDQLAELQRDITKEREVLLQLQGNAAAAMQYPQAPREPKLTIDQVRRYFAGSPGVYFAWDAETGEPVYVGRSANIGNRVSGSRPELQGTLLTAIRLPESECSVAELYYIATLRPRRNSECSKLASNEINQDDTDEINESISGDGRKTANVAAAESLLREIMSRSSGVTPAKEAEEEMRAAGHSRRTIRKARDAAGVRSRKSGMSGGWVWEWIRLDDHGALLELLISRGGKVKRTAIMNSIRRYRRSEALDAALAVCSEAGLLRVEAVREGDRGPKTEWVVLQDRQGE